MIHSVSMAFYEGTIWAAPGAPQVHLRKTEPWGSGSGLEDGCTAPQDAVQVCPKRAKPELNQTVASLVQDSFLFLTLAKINIQPFTNDFLQADIHELPSPDLLHQIIQGTFKDHIVRWVEDYIHITKTKERAEEILDDIDWQ